MQLTGAPDGADGGEAPKRSARFRQDDSISTDGWAGHNKIE